MYNSFFLCTFAVGMQKRGIILLLVTTLLLSCSPKALREAEEVVAQADSMRAAGQMYADSVRLAQSYSTLRAWRAVRADEYAHACYHYGRLLREKDNPVEAMQCFIEASHAHTRDHHILGRVYSNMGSICHLAGEFPLAYDMYERSAEMFLHNGDSTAYFYALNDMAYELASAGLKDSCLALLYAIEKRNIDDTYLKTYCSLSHAEVYLRTSQYDSTIYYARESQKYQPTLPASILQLAQAYSFLGFKDSAVYYAKYVLSLSNVLFNKNSAMYILTHNDDSKDREEVRKISADRSDVQKLIEIQQGKLSQAVQLLEQDWNSEPDFRWLISIVGTLIVVSCIICIYVYRKRKRQALLSQQIEQLKSEYTDLQINKEKQLAQTCAILRASKKLQEDLCWKDFEQMCVVVNKHFYMLANKLRQKDVLNETEIRLCILVLLGLSRIEIASMLPYALSGVGKLKDHTAKLLGTTGRNLHDFLLNMAVVG